MQAKFYFRLQVSLLLSTSLCVGLTTLIPRAEARIISNGVLLNGMDLQFDSVSTAQLQLEGSQLVLNLNH
jgi:hypothetical protein